MKKPVSDGDRTASVTLDGSECEVIFSNRYNVFSVEAENDVVIALESGKKAGDDGTLTCKGGGSLTYDHMKMLDRVYLIGSGKVQVIASNNAINHFKKAPKGGDKDNYMIYNQGKDKNGHVTSVYHSNSNSGKYEYGIYVYYWFGGVVVTDMLDFRGYKRIGVAIRSAKNGTALPAQTSIAIYGNNEVNKGANDYWISDPITDPIYVANANGGDTNMGGIFYVDIPDGVDTGYWGLNTVNDDTWVYAIWLE